MKFRELIRQQLSSKYCILCREAVRESGISCEDLCICPECEARMELYLPGTSFSGDETVKTVYAAAPYRGILRDAFLHHKFYEQKAFYKIFAILLIRALEPVMNQMQYDLILPVPLSPKRMNERGYNQAGLLAREVSSHFGIEYSDTALFRTRNTAKQSLLQPHQRLKNVENAFLADREKVQEKRILVIDGILTFGATLSASGQALLDAGAAGIDAAVLFKAVPRNDENDHF